MRKLLSTIVATFIGGLLAILCSGCGTITNNEGSGRIYGGVAIDSVMGTRNDVLGCGPWWLVDLPFSFVGDTLSVPFIAYGDHQAKEYQESLKRFPLDPDPLAGWKHNSDVKPDPAIVRDYESYIESLPTDQRKALVVNQYMVRLFADAKGAHAMEIRLLLRNKEWKHVLIYNDSNERIIVMKYVSGHVVS